MVPRILPRLRSGLEWRVRKLQEVWEGYGRFPWFSVSRHYLFHQKVLQKQEADPATAPAAKTQVHMLAVGRRTKAVGGPQTKLMEMEKALSVTHQPNVLFVSSGSPPPIVALRWAKKCGLKILLNQNGVYYPAATKHYKKINANIGMVHQLADFVVYQTEFCRSAFTYWVDAPAEQHTIIWNGVDTRCFIPKPSRDWPAKTLRILMTGSINMETEYQFQTIPEMLEALAQQPKKNENGFDRFQFFFAGKTTSKLKKQFEDLACQYGVSHPWVEFHFLGPYQRAQAPHIYQTADVYLHLKYKDPCPNAVAEAMASGLPVICGQSGGTSELVGRGGICLPIDDVWDTNLALSADSIASALLNLTLDQLRGLSQEARHRAEAYMSLDNWVKQHIEIAQSLLN